MYGEEFQFLYARYLFTPTLALPVKGEGICGISG
jgi:hypothetical protein